MNQMKSFGLWYKPRRVKSNIPNIPNFDMHINLWDINSTGNKEKDCAPSIDFGIKVSNFIGISEIYFSIPFNVKLEEILDLSHVLKSEEVQLIFNDVTYKYGEMTRPYNGITNDKEKIIILPLKQGMHGELVPQVEFNPTNGEENVQSSTIKIKLSQYGDIFKSATSIYFRFRIMSPNVGESLISKLQEKNYFLESAFEERKIIDIKVNNARNINDYTIVHYEQQKCKFAKFKSVHLFVMVPSFYEVTIWDNFSECRLLENDSWKRYLEGLTTNDIIAYHWKKKSKDDLLLDDFTQLIKISNRARNLKIILIYCFIVIFLGAIGSGLFWLIQELFNL